MKTIDFSYFIERYIAGEMNEAEKEWFRNELRKNEKLRDEVTLRQKADIAIKRIDIMELRNKLSAIEKKKADTVPVKSNRKHLTLPRAAIIAGIILGGSLAFMSTRNLTTDEVFDRFYKSYDVTTNLRSVETVENPDYSTAIEYFNVRDYNTAAHYFSKVVSSDLRYMESIMLNGISRFEEENYSEAQHSFMKVIDNNENLFVEDAQYFLALCYLKTGELEKATNQLTLIKRSGNIYSDDARKILRKIK